MDDTPTDLIPTAAAAALVPSCRPGRQTHISTLYRWMETGRLRWWRNGRWRLVSRAEVLGLLRPAGQARAAPAAAAQTAADLARQEAWADGVLRRAGI